MPDVPMAYRFYTDLAAPVGSPTPPPVVSSFPVSDRAATFDVTMQLGRHTAKLVASVVTAAVLMLGACSGIDTQAGTSTVAEPTTAAAPSTTTTAAAITTTPEAAPTTAAEATETTTLGKLIVEVRGADDFVVHTDDALALLEAAAPDAHEQVVAYIDVIVSVPAGSGMLVEAKTMQVGDITAHAPGFTAEDQVIWYASAITHDSCHSRQYSDDDPHIGKAAEVECLDDQAAALELIARDAYLGEYVQGLIDGANDPENQYWTNPDRHW